MKPKRQDATFTIRLYQDDLNAIRRALHKTGKSLSKAVREVMLKWAAKQ